VRFNGEPIGTAPVRSQDSLQVCFLIALIE